MAAIGERLRRDHMTGMAELTTPCLKICVMDRASGLCVGCGRTMPEIVGWLRMSEAERLAIMAEARIRLATLASGPREEAVP